MQGKKFPYKMCSSANANIQVDIGSGIVLSLYTPYQVHKKGPPLHYVYSLSRGHILVRNVPLTERDRQMLKTHRNINKTSVADPGIRCLFDPWIRDPGGVKKSKSGSGMNIPDHISERLETIFWVKIINVFDAMWIRIRESF
jgi:hypothetical protein